MALVYQPCRAFLNDAALLIAEDMAVNFQGDSRVRVSQLPLHDGRSCALRLSKLYAREEKKSKTSWRAETVDYEKIAGQPSKL